jgi:DNA polymerase III delta prime subunit
MNNLKIIILDEAEAITYQGQNALKSVMEEHDQYVRFILTTNEPDKLNKAIRSRCKSIQFDGLERKRVGKLLYDILMKENVKFTMEDLKKLVDTHYPDLRIMIRDAQSFTENGVMTVPDKIFTSTSEYDSIIDLLVDEPQGNTFTKIRQLVADQNIKSFDRLYSYIYENLDKIPVNRRTKTILAVGQAIYQQNFVVDKEITFMACVAQIIT